MGNCCPNENSPRIPRAKTSSAV